MTNLNPFSPPSRAAHVVEGESFLPPRTRLITWLAILISTFGLVATYGYPSRMTLFWCFYLLPSLALLVCVLTSIGLGRRVPNSRGVSVVPAVVTLSIIGMFAIFAGVVSVVAEPPWGYLVDMLPRLIATGLGWIAATIYTVALHGSTSGRRGLMVANGMAIFQATTSIADTILLGFGPW